MCTRNVLLQRLVNGAHYACESRAGFSPAGGWTRQTPRSGLVCRKKLTSLVRHGSLEWQAAPTPRARSLGPEVLYGRTEFQYRQAWKPGSVDGIWTWFPSGIQTWVFRLLTFQLGICWRGARPQGFFCSLSLSYIRLTLYLKMHGGPSLWLPDVGSLFKTHFLLWLVVLLPGWNNFRGCSALEGPRLPGP